MPAKVTLQTIADLMGVSRMTVSNAFSHPDQLSAELRSRILAKADELGYVAPDPAARALARGTTGAVGVLLTDSLQEAFTDEVSTATLAAIVDGLAPTGLALTLLTSTERDDVVPARDVAIDGAIIYSCYPSSTALDWLIRRRLPLVLVDQYPMKGADAINVDDRGGAGAAAQHVVELGHRDVAIVHVAPTGRGDPDEPDDYPERERLVGWTDALRAASIEPSVVTVPFRADEETRVLVGRLLAGPDRPTAVLCFADVVARIVVAEARALGLTVPADLSVVGFDDGPSARIAAPTLTTVRQDLDAKGREVAAALTAALAARASGKRRRPRRVVLPTELVVRESTAPPPH